MEQSVHVAARLVWAAKKAYARKALFLGLFVLVFAVTVGVLAESGLLPDASSSSTPVAEAASTSPAAIIASTPESPVKISIPAISLTATIADPTTTDTNALDALLLKGAVHYPTSALLNETGNVVIFGHSSYLPVVGNQAYKTFDGIQKLHTGDTIIVYSSDRAYTYSVATVKEEDANTDAIPLTVNGQVLTLSTCDSFATTSDRFIVTANLVGSQAISS